MNAQSPSGKKAPKIIPTLNPIYAKRRQHRLASEYDDIWNILDGVDDPELPGLTIWDLGVLQDVTKQELPDGSFNWIISVTPTYSGCPAIDAIKSDIQSLMAKNNIENIEVKVVLSPAWTTDMMSPNGQQHLMSIQIAPPNANDEPQCPVCGNHHTSLISQFGSTACKALYRCDDCHETFDYFKTL